MPKTAKPLSAREARADGGMLGGTDHPENSRLAENKAFRGGVSRFFHPRQWCSWTFISANHDD
jgi:hypothetical protein